MGIKDKDVFEFIGALGNANMTMQEFNEGAKDSAERVKNLKDSLKEKTFFKELRKEVETGANGTQDYVVKKGVNKDTIATTRQ